MESSHSNKILLLGQYLQLIRAQFKSIKRIAPLTIAHKLVHFLSFALRKRSALILEAKFKSKLLVKSSNHQTLTCL